MGSRGKGEKKTKGNEEENLVIFFFLIVSFRKGPILSGPRVVYHSKGNVNTVTFKGDSFRVLVLCFSHCFSQIAMD